MLFNKLTLVINLYVLFCIIRFITSYAFYPYPISDMIFLNRVLIQWYYIPRIK